MKCHPTFEEISNWDRERQREREREREGAETNPQEGERINKLESGHSTGPKYQRQGRPH